MTMPYSPSRAVYEGNDAATRFPFSFKVWDASQLVVTLTSPDGATTEASGWTTDIGASGGEIVYLHKTAPLPAGWKLAITRNMPFTQEVNLVSASRFDPQVIEDALDQATAERQQVKEMLGRAVILPATSSETPQDVVQAAYAARDEAQNASSTAHASEIAAGQSAADAAASANTAAQTVQTATAEAVNAAMAQANAAASSAAAAAQSAIDAAAAVPDNLVQRVTDVESAASAAQSTANTAKAVTDTVTTTPTANAVPKADNNGKIDPRWSGTSSRFFASFNTSEPDGLLCNGGPYSRTTYARLFGIIGTAFGAGDGSTTFNVPDMRGKVIEGADGNLKAVIQDGLPNAKGSFVDVATNTLGVTSGALYSSGYSTYGVGTAGGGCVNISLDLSRSDPRFGRSTKVQPAAIAANIFIKF